MDSENFDFDDEWDFVEFLNGLPAEQKEKLHDLLSVLVQELFTTTTTDNDVVFCGSNGQKVIKCVTCAREALGEDGPVILPSSNSTVILFCVSTEFLEAQVESFRNLYPDSELCEQEWQKFLDSLANDAANLASLQGDPKWEELLI